MYRQRRRESFGGGTRFLLRGLGSHKDLLERHEHRGRWQKDQLCSPGRCCGPFAQGWVDSQVVVCLAAWSIANWIDISWRILTRFLQLRTRRVDEGMSLWRDEHVRKVRFFSLEDDAASCILSGCVRPSVKKSPLYPVVVWLDLTLEGFSKRPLKRKNLTYPTQNSHNLFFYL